jgi:hypothetical protein
VHVAERPNTKRYASTLGLLLVDLRYLAPLGRTRTQTRERVSGRNNEMERSIATESRCTHDHHADNLDTAGGRWLRGTPLPIAIA